MRLSTVIPIYVTTLVAILTFGITYGMELNRYQLTIALAGIPCVSGLLTMWIFRILRSHLSDNHITAQERHITTIWGRPLDKLQLVISLSEERIRLVQTELEEKLQGDSTPIYALVAIGYKCIQTCNAIHILCSKGFPDQALSLCRGLVEQEANLRFIVTIENREEVTERYLDWQRAKSIRLWKARNKELVNDNLEPTSGEWDAVTESYEQLEVKYRGNGNLRNPEGWAIGTMANCSERLTAFSVQERAKQFIRVWASDKALLRDTWTVRWQRLNGFVHTTPRSILESAASNDPKLVVTSPSHLGIDEPLVVAGQAMLNISTMVTYIVADEFMESESLQVKSFGERVFRAFHEMLEEVEKIPGAAARWHTSVEFHDKLSSRSP